MLNGEYINPQTGQPVDDEALSEAIAQLQEIKWSPPDFIFVPDRDYQDMILRGIVDDRLRPFSELY